MLCLCAAQFKFWFQTDLGRENSAIYYRQGRQLLLTFLTLVTLYVQFLCSDWSKFDRWVHAENLCSILNLVYFGSWSWQSFVSTCDVFNCLFPLDVQNEIQLPSGVFPSSWLVSLLLFDWEIRRNFGWHRFRFHLAWFVMHQSIPPAPSPLPGWSRALAFFLPLTANSRGWGLLSCQIPRGGDGKQRANVPSSVNTATSFIARTVN